MSHHPKVQLRRSICKRWGVVEYIPGFINWHETYRWLWLAVLRLLYIKLWMGDLRWIEATNARTYTLMPFHTWTLKIENNLHLRSRW